MVVRMRAAVESSSGAVFGLLIGWSLQLEMRIFLACGAVLEVQSQSRQSSFPAACGQSVKPARDGDLNFNIKSASEECNPFASEDCLKN